MNPENEIIEIQNPPVTKHPAELILAGIKEKLSAFEQEHQQLISQLENQYQEIKRLHSEVEKHGQEKKIWLTQLIAYWQREVDLINLTTQIKSDLTPEQKEVLLEQMQQLNQTNVKFARTYQAKGRWKKTIFYSLMALLLLVLGAGVLWKLRHYLRSNSN